MKNNIKQAVEILNQGGIIIYPTDTAFGIGCRMDNEEAVERLFAIRKRPLSQATPVLMNNIQMVEKYIKKIPEDVETDLIKKYWPGALTLVLHCFENKVPELVRGGGSNLGVRIPDNDDVLSIIEHVGVPILGPSANFHNGKTPFRFEDIEPELIKMVDYVLPGEIKLYQLSTVVDCTVKPWKVLREGAINLKFKIQN